MREHSQYRGGILHETFFPYPVMLHRTKYSRFRNDSLASTEEGTPSVSLNTKTRADTHPPGTSSLPVENIAMVSQDTSTAICTLIPKKYHFRLSSPTSLLGFKHFSLGTKEVSRAKATESPASPSGTVSAEITANSHLNSFPPSRQDEDVKNSNTNLLLEIEKPPLDKRQNYSRNMSRSNMGTGLSYYVIYMGCIEVLQSMRSLDFGTRSQVTREAISRLCEAVPGAKGATKKRKPPLKFLSSVLGKSNLQFSGMNVTLTISTSSLILTNVDTKQVVANHHMQSISFASGGDPDTTDYIAYVAKDPVNQRACHILECTNSKAQEVISTIGHAFELRFKQYLKSPSFIDSSDSELLNFNNATHKIEEKEGHDYYNETPRKVPPAGGAPNKRTPIESNGPIDPGDEQHSQMGFTRGTNIYENCIENLKIKGLSAQNGLHILADKEQMLDDPSYINTGPKTDTSDKNHTFCGQNATSDAQDILESRKLCQGNKKSLSSSVQREEWYHGKMNRKNTESILINDGDFLVRESTTSPNQYVLSGLHGGQHKHLLLVDPEGKVRTKDHIFENVNHLIKYHMESKLPIISSGSELCLRHPVTVLEVRMIKD